MDNAGARLVLLHPIGNNKDCWQFLDLQALELSDIGFYEMPGHGSRARQPDMTFASMADEVVEQFDGPLDLVGVAVGGSVALNVLARHPERVRSALVACAGAGGGNAAARQTRIARGEAAVTGGMASVIDETFSRWFTPYAVLSDHPGVAFARRTLLEMDPGAWSDIWRATAVSEPIPQARLSAITQPVSLVGAVHDASAGVAGVQTFHELIPNSRLQYVPGSHMLHLEQPQNLLAAIDQHLSWRHIAGTRIDTPVYSAGV